jgi:hypothetical protein
VHCALGLSPRQGSACSAKRPSHLGWWPTSTRQGRHSATAALVVARSDSGGARRRGVAGRFREQGGRVVDPFWGSRKEELTGRMSSKARCGRREGNGGGGGIRGWWSTARGVGRLYTVAQCSGRGQNGRREAGAGCPRRLNGGGTGSAARGVKSGGGRKGAPRWGVGTHYSG